MTAPAPRTRRRGPFAARPWPHAKNALSTAAITSGIVNTRWTVDSSIQTGFIANGSRGQTSEGITIYEAPPTPLLLSQLFYHNSSITTLLSQLFYHNSSITTLLSQFFYHNSSITTLLSQLFYHNSSITTLLSQLFYHNSSITLMPLHFFTDASSTILPSDRNLPRKPLPHVQLESVVYRALGQAHGTSVLRS
jgi:hypothetical protein